ncbi:MAG TPA: hypothetical protein VGJ66_24820 [Pyrinomonadaceae bacterium]|jgi:hypothetical protein
MDLRNFFAELKRRNVKVAVAYGVVAQLLIQVATLHHSLKSPVSLARVNHVVRFIVNANHGIM